MAPITDDEWADLVAHELPNTADSVIQSYLESRRALMDQEQKHRSGTVISYVLYCITTYPSGS
jgi:adenosine deaminase CECR1